MNEHKNPTSEPDDQTDDTVGHMPAVRRVEPAEDYSEGHRHTVRRVEPAEDAVDDDTDGHRFSFRR